MIVHLKKLGSDAAYRRACGEFLCDGEKLLAEAIMFRAGITAVLYSAGLPDGFPDTVPAYKVGQALIDAVSPLKTPQNVVFSCRIPDAPVNPGAAGFTVILEGLQDPGNVGTILRTAAAFGVGRVLLAGGCADPYHPKTIRASMGAVFRQHVADITPDGVRALKDQGVPLYGAALSPGSLDIRTVNLQNAAVAIGSEGRGLSDELLALCDATVIIPMVPTSESLNAAAAASIIMWEATKEHGL